MSCKSLAMVGFCAMPDFFPLVPLLVSFRAFFNAPGWVGEGARAYAPGHACDMAPTHKKGKAQNPRKWPEQSGERAWLVAPSTVALEQTWEKSCTCTIHQMCWHSPPTLGAATGCVDPRGCLKVAAIACHNIKPPTTRQHESSKARGNSELRAPRQNVQPRRRGPSNKI